jgi:hypothetical protein
MNKLWPILLLLPGMSAGEELVIHRCVAEDGTVAFQERPCIEREAGADDVASDNTEQSAVTEDVFDFTNPYDAPDALAPYPEPAAPAPPSPHRAECEKEARDAIDAIDAEMRKGYTKEEGQQYLAELMQLTQALRACKRQ